MSDDLKVDWGRSIKDENGVPMQYHEYECTTEPAYPRYVTCPSDPMIVSYYDDYGRPWSEHKPRIRNVEPAQADMGNPMMDDLAKRMEALVRRIADGEHFSDSAEARAVTREARAIVALLPEPVDADLLQVRRIVAEALPHGMRADILSGAQDHTVSIQAPLACLKAGRALERDSREG